MVLTALRASVDRLPGCMARRLVNVRIPSAISTSEMIPCLQVMLSLASLQQGGTLLQPADQLSRLWCHPCGCRGCLRRFSRLPACLDSYPCGRATCVSAHWGAWLATPLFASARHICSSQDALLSYVAVVMMALEMVGVPLLPQVRAFVCPPPAALHAHLPRMRR